MGEPKTKVVKLTAAQKKAAADAKKAELKSKREPNPNKTDLSLSVKDRIVINGILPKKGNMLMQVLIRDIIDKIRINQDEMDNIKFEVVGNGFKWNEEKAIDIDISFSGAEFKILLDAVNDLDKKNEVTQELLGLCQKIKKIEP